jgi:hypothetical protein
VAGEIRNGQTIQIDADPKGSGLVFDLVAEPEQEPVTI